MIDMLSVLFMTWHVTEAKGFVTSDLVTNGGKDTRDLVKAISHSQGNHGY